MEYEDSPDRENAIEQAREDVRHEEEHAGTPMHCGICGPGVECSGHPFLELVLRAAAQRPPQIDHAGDYVCEHGTAMDVHCCGCHSGYLFDITQCTCLDDSQEG